MRATICLFAIAMSFLTLNTSIVSAEVQPSPEMLRGPTATPSVDETGIPSSQSDVVGRTFSDRSPVRLDGGKYVTEVTPQTMVAVEAEQALDLVPDWLRMELYDMFTRMSTGQQEVWGQLLLDIEDPRIIDEVAFTIAHSSKDMLRAVDPQLYVKNAQLLYQISPDIPYADIVDHGTPGQDPDYYSTVRYKTIRGGVLDEYELPREIYYWYIVHPKHGDETPSMSPTLSDINSTYGYFWREYLFYNPSEEYDYTNYYLNKSPNWITDGDVDGWGPSATGYLTDGYKRYRASIMMSGSDSEKPVLCEYPWSMSRVIVTTMDVERAYSAGNRKLLENIVMRSDGILGELLVPSDWVGIVDDTGDPNIVGPIEDVLNKNHIPYEKFTSDDFIIRFWDHCSKVIIASHQSRAFYEALANENVVTQMRSWLSNHYVTFEFNGACDVSAAWGDLDLPFGLGYVPEETNDVTIGHYPVLRDVIANASHVWDDSVVDASLPTFRPFEPNSMAVDVIGNWVSRLLPFRARGNRPIQANQICFEHNGNCGEIQDLMNTAARTCLLPCAGVNNFTWDHVSNEFWEGDWHGYQVDWNGNHTSVAKQGILYDKDFGGSKDLSAIMKDRGDTYPLNATARFSKVCKFHARVEDVNHNPVDGAQIVVRVPLYNKPQNPLYTAITAYTDSTGEVVMDLGDNRDFWMSVRSRIGQAGESQVLTNTVAGEEYSHTWTLDGQMPQLPPIENAQFADGDHQYKLDISYNVEFEMLYSVGGSTFGNNENAGNVDFFIVSPDEFDKYQDGHSFQAYEWRSDSPGDSVSVEVPSQTYYIVFSNEDVVDVKQFVTLQVNVSKKVGGTWQQVQSYDNYVAIPHQNSYVLKFTPSAGPSFPPHIYAAGYLDASVNSVTGFELGMQAFVVDTDGPSDVQSVEAYYGGVPLGIFLKDDGIEPDNLAGDGIFTCSVPMGPGEVGPGLYRVELVATDAEGNQSPAWPYLNVLSGPLALPSEVSQMNVDLWQPAATSDGAPTIIGGGFWGGESVAPGDTVKMIVLVSDPDGPSDIDRVELFLEGGVPTGLYFNDSGVGGDDFAGDGIYTFQVVMPGGLPGGNMTLEAVAFDKSGNSSVVYPYLTVN